MTFWIGLFVGTIVVPLLVLIWRRNFKTLLLCYLPFVGYAFYLVHPACDANRASEACTWGYMNYAIALTIGAAVYIVVSILQGLYGFYRERQQREQ